MQKPIFIIGYMGSGKSRLAKVLSESLSCSHHDLDDLISQAHGKTIEEIFNSEGEIAFRKMEKRQLRLLNESFGVVSMGGGTPCYFNTIKMLNTINRIDTVFLRTSINNLVKRLSKNKSQRPVLKNFNTNRILSEYIGKHLFERNEFYNKSKFIIDTNNKSIDEVVNQIILTLT